MFDPPIAEEWPPAANQFASLEVYVDDLRRLLGEGKLREHLALRSGSEGAAPEGNARLGVITGRRFPPDTIDSDDGETVGDCVTAHHQLPGGALSLLLLPVVSVVVADGSGVDQ